MSRRVHCCRTEREITGSKMQKCTQCCLRYALSCIAEETAAGPAVSNESFRTFCSAAARAIGVPFSETRLQEHTHGQQFLTTQHMLTFIDCHLLSTKRRARDRVILERFCWDTRMNEELHQRRFHWGVVGPTGELAFQLWRVFATASDGSRTVSSTKAAWMQCRLRSEVHPTHLSPSRASLSVASRGGLSYWQLLEVVASLLSVTSEAEEGRHLQTVQAMLLEVENRVIMQGQLEKRGHIRRNWKQRCFVLSPGLLKYYTSSSFCVLKGTCHITPESSLRCVNGESTRDFRFTVSCGRTGKVFEMSAANEEERKVWVAYIRFAMKHPGVTTMERFTAIEKDRTVLFVLSQSAIGGATYSLEESLLHSSHMFTTLFCFVKCLLFQQEA